MSDRLLDSETKALHAHGLAAAFRLVVFWGVMFGAGEASFALFASYLHAPAFFFGLLAGLPCLLGPLAQAVSANLLDRQGRRMPLVLGPMLVQALCFIPLAALPFFEPGAAVYALFLALVILYFLTAHLSHPPWYSLLGDLLPDAERGSYFAKLSRIPTLVALLAQLAVGGALYLAVQGEAVGWIFAGAFALSGAARLVSFAIARGIREPPYRSGEADTFTFWQFIRRTRESNFVKFGLFVALFHFGAYIAAPYFLPYFIYDLAYSPWHWTLLASSGTLASILTMLAWGRFGDRFGNKRTIQISALFICLVPLGWLFTTDLAAFVAIQMLGAAFWTGFTISVWNYILEAVSPPKRARCVAYFNLLVGLGIFLGSLAGEPLYRWLPRMPIDAEHSSSFLYLLVISLAFRLLVCLVFLPMFRELRAVPPFPIARWFFTVTQMRSIYGLLWGVIAEQGPERKKTPAENGDAPK